MRVFRWLTVILMVAAFSVAARAQGAEKSEDEIKAESAQAQALYDKQNYIGALPLYEELHALRPQSMVFTERLAFSLLANAGQQDPQAAKATRQRAKDLLLQAKAGGDNSNLLQVLLERLQDDGPGKGSPQPVGHEWVEKGEAAFSKGDLATAVGFYQKALEENPQYYAAALFAGDAEYKQKHTAEAGKWFAQAIAINPDVETAHRYWGDCLEAAGEHQRAEEQFVEAIVADPYSKTPRIGLKQWADRNHAMIAGPPIKLPGRATQGQNGNINISIDGSKPAGDPETALALMYSMNSALWQGEKFKKQYPNEKVYRHSLAEEADGIRGMLAVAKEQKIPDAKLSTSTRLLLELDRNGMLESWILLDDADQGIAQDYVAYRKEHRDLMAKYIAQYDVHKM